MNLYTFCMCILLTALLVSIEQVGGKLTIQNVDVNDAPEDEYIAVLKGDYLSSLGKDRLTKLVQKIIGDFGCIVRARLQVGHMHSLRIKGVLSKVLGLLELKEIAHIERNMYVRAIQAPSPDISVCYTENSGRNLWGLSRVSRRNKIPLLGSVKYTWGDEDDGSGVIAYVLDTGIDISHVEFEGRARWGFMASSFQEASEDLHGHGTHVAGTIGGRSTGIAKGVDLVAVKVLNAEGAGTIADIAEGIQWATDDFSKQNEENGQKSKGVMNLSLGATGSSYVLELAAKRAMDAGVTVVVAAGNEYDDACNHTPANIDSVLTIGATDKNDNMAEFSNYGKCVDLLAPGDGILSSYIGGKDTYAVVSGTSQSSPHVAGVVARYLSLYNPPLSPDQIKDLLDQDVSQNKINLEVGSNAKQRLTTPNKLLYRACSVGSAQSGVLPTKFTPLTVFLSAIVCLYIS